jgi:hypothetical protein
VTVEPIFLLSPIEAGQEEELRATLGAYNKPGASPFADVPGTHVARFVVVNWLGTGDRTSRRRLRPARLLFSAFVDGPVEAWLWGLFEKQRAAVDSIWRHCCGWPAAGDPQAGARWLLEQRVDVTYPLVANDRTVSEIRRGLGLRRALMGLKAKADLLTAPELREAYQRAMAEVER